MSHHCGLDLDDTRTNFCNMLWHSVVHHHTMFGYERSSNSDVAWTIIH